MPQPSDLRVYYTDSGSASDGSTVGSAGTSLGGYRGSGLVAQKATDQAPTNVTGVSIVLASDLHSDGDGNLHFVQSTGTAYWTPPSGTEGAGVVISGGGRLALEGGGGTGAGKFILVDVTPASLPVANAADDNIALSDDYLNVAFDDVSAAESTAGDTEYRCLCIKNHNAGQMPNLRIYMAGVNRTNLAAAIDADDTTITVDDASNFPGFGYLVIGSEIIRYSGRTATLFLRCRRGLKSTSAAAHLVDVAVTTETTYAIAYESPSSQPSGNFQTIATEGTAPSGLTWHDDAIGINTAISVGSFASGNILGIWMRRVVAAGASPIAYDTFRLAFSWGD